MFYRFIRKLLSIYDSLGSELACYWLRSAGARLGKDVMCYGIPVLSVRKGSKIIIGDFTTLRSISRGNAIGVNHRIVLTTHSSEAFIEIGNHVGMSGGAICCKSHVKIGDNTLLGANTIIADNDMHPIKPENRRYNCADVDIPAKPVYIGNNVWIGADVFICKGVSIGDNSVIGAKSLVSKSIPANCIAAGNPAKVIKKDLSQYSRS
ncbi:acyltransferase [Sulfuricaulis limicola]|uniref:acyltransferase n=1 Tax=Sulfuricaulis limicola TaxID=1620215 RepID=UPI0018D58306|nr:acyltransferase [Sulfuricaulis limicola]